MKKNVLILLTLLTIVISGLGAQDVRMRNWKFEWTVLDAYDRQFKIMKTEDLTVGRFYSSYNFVDFYPEEALLIAGIFWKTQDELDSLKVQFEETRIEVRKKVSINARLNATYIFDENGGRVYIAETDDYSLDVSFKPEVAEMMAEKLEKAELYFQAVSERINP